MRTLTLTLMTFAALAAAPTLAQECAQDSEDEACGAPGQTGGGCGCGCGGSILIAYTDQGDSYQYADDFDDDGVEDVVDNAPFEFNPDQIDTDGDEIGDIADLCPGSQAPFLPGSTTQRIQLDTDGDRLGDECDDDKDGDLFPNSSDNCPGVINPFLALNGNQLDADNDGVGDACDNDDDADGCLDATDNCPLQPATNCTENLAVVPNECFPDADGDGIEDVLDLCASVPDLAQLDSDNDGLGDLCDGDLDNDNVPNEIDNCRQLPNFDQANEDRDGFGDACDALRCFVVDGDEANCLNTEGPFSVKAALAEQRLNDIKTGDDILLHIFANRENKAIRYTWVVVDQPSDGDATISNPKGAVSFSNSIQYVYESDRAARFNARVPGEYTVELQAELAFDDDKGYDVTAAKSQMKIKVGGERLGGCSAVPASTPAVLALVGVALALRRRRR